MIRRFARRSSTALPGLTRNWHPGCLSASRQHTPSRVESPAIRPARRRRHQHWRLSRVPAQVSSFAFNFVIWRADLLSLRPRNSSIPGRICLAASRRSRWYQVCGAAQPSGRRRSAVRTKQGPRGPRYRVKCRQGNRAQAVGQGYKVGAVAVEPVPPDSIVDGSIVDSPR
jgi:hypothetical protein